MRRSTKLRQEGVVKAIGVGLNEVRMCERFARAGDFDTMLLAGRYSLLEQDALDGFLALAAQKGIGLMLGGVFNSGILATGAVPGAHYNYRAAPPDILAKTAANRRGLPRSWRRSRRCGLALSARARGGRLGRARRRDPAGGPAQHGVACALHSASAVERPQNARADPPGRADAGLSATPSHVSALRTGVPRKRRSLAARAGPGAPASFVRSALVERRRRGGLALCRQA